MLHWLSLPLAITIGTAGPSPSAIPEIVSDQARGSQPASEPEEPTTPEPEPSTAHAPTESPAPQSPPDSRPYEGPLDAGPPIEPAKPIPPPKPEPTAPLPPPSYTPPRPPLPPRSGRPLLITGGIISGIGIAIGLASTLTTTLVDCIGCFEPNYLHYTLELTAPIVILAGLPFLGVGMHRTRMRMTYDAMVHQGHEVLRPRRGPLIAGVLMTILGSALLVTAVTHVRVVTDIPLWVGTPLAVGGVLLAADSHARVRASKRWTPPHLSLVPTPTPHGLALTGRF